MPAEAIDKGIVDEGPHEHITFVTDIQANPILGGEDLQLMEWAIDQLD